MVILGGAGAEIPELDVVGFMVKLKPELVMINIPSFSAPAPAVVLDKVFGDRLAILPN